MFSLKIEFFEIYNSIFHSKCPDIPTYVVIKIIDVIRQNVYVVNITTPAINVMISCICVRHVRLNW